MPMQVIVVPHDPRWAEQFAVAAALVRQALGSSVVAVHHIGSTAIPTIYAKPILDLLVEVTDVAALDAHNPAMIALGYEACGEFGIPGRRYYRKDDAAGIRTHHVHAFTRGSLQVIRHLAFRDYLLAHPDRAREYSDLKRRLVAAHPADIEQYMDGKDEFIQETDRRAAAWQTARNAPRC